ncbi:AcrR family transcriptional regulator [Hamadaea flava]|uniref:TetR/AcrR family transcriptional regulator n=1 Tax=Hamadaea flava TaxID=1742688 RepID=A0ABV8M126_9ACTN|nr:TetR/AcrR family transcriptional regulator [Hamadaea flava]MCP2321916.1 AcrR family transcriptional regulator [Hamadaea flava]
MTQGLSGRRAQAARNDEAILEAAREVFLADPKAPVAAVADRAGVGMSALYRRFPGKEDMLRRLCHDGLLRYNAEAEHALAQSKAQSQAPSASQPDAGWQALEAFLGNVVDADVHSLTVHLAGTFTPTEEMAQAARRSGELAARLVTDAQPALRPGVGVTDLGFVLEACAAIRVPDAVRTKELRRRYLAVILAGLRRAEGSDASKEAIPELPGPPPTAVEANWRWRIPAEPNRK